MAKIKRFNKQELVDYCKSIGIDTNKQLMKMLMAAVELYRKNEIRSAIKTGKAAILLFSKIEELAENYALNLRRKIDVRKEEMKGDDNAHYLIYNVLGITTAEGILIKIATKRTSQNE